MLKINQIAFDESTSNFEWAEVKFNN